MSINTSTKVIIKAEGIIWQGFQSNQEPEIREDLRKQYHQDMTGALHSHLAAMVDAHGLHKVKPSQHCSTEGRGAH